eukprot:TRINITY_DN4583_c0_g1_i2.p1 TRINITY_DN4583_c0_g1~~TRINITY_DN4583_c0_g1_i2.p1  ORF type:complete len:349 (+),score=54.27 TRINITY_DN4583_c0_g1_i2:110-1156(+)
MPQKWTPSRAGLGVLLAICVAIADAASSPRLGRLGRLAQRLEEDVRNAALGNGTDPSALLPEVLASGSRVSVIDDGGLQRLRDPFDDVSPAGPPSETSRGNHPRRNNEGGRIADHQNRRGNEEPIAQQVTNSPDPVRWPNETSFNSRITGGGGSFVAAAVSENGLQLGPIGQEPRKYDGGKFRQLVTAANGDVPSTSGAADAGIAVYASAPKGAPDGQVAGTTGAIADSATPADDASAEFSVNASFIGPGVRVTSDPVVNATGVPLGSWRTSLVLPAVSIAACSWALKYAILALAVALTLQGAVLLWVGQPLRFCETETSPLKRALALHSRPARGSPPLERPFLLQRI